MPEVLRKSLSVQHSEYSGELLDVIFKVALHEISRLPVDQADQYMVDLRNGNAVIALYVADGTIRIKLNPEMEAIQSCFPLP